MTREYDTVKTDGRDLDLLTLGQVPLRLSPPDNERLPRSDTFVKQVGGVELNVTMGAALLGLHIGVIFKLPAHDIGSFMRGKTRSFGINDNFFMYDQFSVARVGIYYCENGAYPRKPKVIYDRNHNSFFPLDIDKIPEEVYMASKCFHTTGVILVLNGDIHETTIEMTKRFKAAGTLVFFDVNFRGSLRTRDQARECILRIPPYVDIFFCFEDIARLTFLKTGMAREMMKSFTEEFPISIVVSTQRIVRSPKCYTFGSVTCNATKDEYYKEKPYRDIEVVDRIGSDDAYISGALYGLSSTDGDCVKAIAFGNATAVIRNTTPGDLPPSNLEEIQTIIRAYNQVGSQSEMTW